MIEHKYLEVYIVALIVKIYPLFLPLYFMTKMVKEGREYRGKQRKSMLKRDANVEIYGSFKSSSSLFKFNAV